MATFLSEVARASSGSTFELVEQVSGRVLVPALEVAVDSATRKKGLLGRDGLGEGSGLVIAPTNAVHTFFMRFPIDIVFATKSGQVVKVVEAVPAWRIAAAWRGYAVVELPAGTARKAGIVKGSAILVKRCQS